MTHKKKPIEVALPLAASAEHPRASLELVTLVLELARGLPEAARHRCQAGSAE